MVFKLQYIAQWIITIVLATVIFQQLAETSGAKNLVIFGSYTIVIYEGVFSFGLLSIALLGMSLAAVASKNNGGLDTKLPKFPKSYILIWNTINICIQWYFTLALAYSGYVKLATFFAISQFLQLVMRLLLLKAISAIKVKPVAIAK